MNMGFHSVPSLVMKRRDYMITFLSTSLQKVSQSYWEKARGKIFISNIYCRVTTLKHSKDIFTVLLNLGGGSSYLSVTTNIKKILGILNVIIKIK